MGGSHRLSECRKVHQFPFGVCLQLPTYIDQEPDVFNVGSLCLTLQGMDISIRINYMYTDIDMGYIWMGLDGLPSSRVVWPI